MTYGQIKQEVLDLLDQFTISGEEIVPTYNNQADYIRRIPGLFNHALMDIRTVWPRRGTHTWENTSEGWEGHNIPRKMRRYLTGTLCVLEDGQPPYPATQYKLVGERTIYTPPGKYVVECEYAPELLPTSPLDSYEPDEDAEVLTACEYYAAAQLIMQEDEYAHSALMQEYESRKASFALHITAEYGDIFGLEPPYCCSSRMVYPWQD